MCDCVFEIGGLCMCVSKGVFVSVHMCVYVFIRFRVAIISVKIYI